MPYLNFVSTEPGADAQRANAGYMEYGSDQLNPVGSFPFRVDQAGNVTASPASMLGLKAVTPMAGVALVNGTPTILSWTAPNDGQLHRVLILVTLDVTSAETGGQVFYQMTAPDGTVGFPPLVAAAQPAGLHPATGNGNIKPGTQVLIQQTALTAGAAVLWAEIWGS